MQIRTQLVLTKAAANPEVIHSVLGDESPESFARRVGISNMSIRNSLEGKELTPNTAEILAQATGLPASKFFQRCPAQESLDLTLKLLTGLAASNIDYDAIAADMPFFVLAGLPLNASRRFGSEKPAYVGQTSLEEFIADIMASVEHLSTKSISLVAGDDATLIRRVDHVLHQGQWLDVAVCSLLRMRNGQLTRVDQKMHLPDNDPQWQALLQTV